MLFCKDTSGLLQAMSFDHDSLMTSVHEHEGLIADEVRFLGHEEAVEINSLNRYDVNAPLGIGTYGRVFLVTDRVDGRQVAMKIIRKRDISRMNAHLHLANELTISQLRFDCPFINNAGLIYEGPKHHFLVTQFVEGGELYHLIHRRGSLTESETRFYAAELLLALQALHGSNVLYRDMKPENILLHADGHIAMVDFGLSKPDFSCRDTTKSLCGTAEYVAPEMLVGDPYGFPIDIWCLGCVIYEMLTGAPPFFDSRQSVMNENIVFQAPAFPPHLTSSVISLVSGMLNKFPEKRMTISQAMLHPWFSDVDWDQARRRSMAPPYIPCPMQAVYNCDFS